MVLGADGMLGHQVVRTVVEHGHEAVASLRSPPAAAVARALRGARVVHGVDARQSDTVVDALAQAPVDAVVNCVGIVKQRQEASDAIQSIRVNSLFPHELAALCRVAGARLLHISTDCVFSGRKGNYTEEDLPDPVDLYGRTKLLGEVSGAGATTLRTSMIGLELTRKESLVEWFLQQTAEVSGWTNAFFSGLTTFELARVLVRLLERHPDLDGLWHVSADPVDKYSLLCRIKDALGLNVAVRADPGVMIDRTLDSTAFRAATGWEAPGWHTMLEELAEGVRRRMVDSGA